MLVEPQTPNHELKSFGIFFAKALRQGKEAQALMTLQYCWLSEIM
jgi:hypothetical protein